MMQPRFARMPVRRFRMPRKSQFADFSLNMQAWARVVKKQQLQAELIGAPISDFKLLHTLELPTFRARLLPCRQFLSDIKWFKAYFVFPRYVFSLVPCRPGLKKYSMLDARSVDNAVDFIESHAHGCTEDYLVLISEFELNAYGGSIVSDNGRIAADIAAGRLSRSQASGVETS
jgi:hypothetical protein